MDNWRESYIRDKMKITIKNILSKLFIQTQQVNIYFKILRPKHRLGMPPPFPKGETVLNPSLAKRGRGDFPKTCFGEK